MPGPLQTEWKCLDPECPAGGSSAAGDPAAVLDKQAEKHVKTAGHGTVTATRPAGSGN